MKKNKQQQIRLMILDEYKLGNNPRDTSHKIQKVFGYNFETRMSTIRLWFEQFYLGDECLENDPFREDLVHSKTDRQLRKRTEVVSSSIITTRRTTTSSLLDSNSKNSPKTDTQTQKLLFKLKHKVDLLYKKINAQNSCLKLVDRFLKKLNPHNYISSSDEDLNPLGTFCKNYRFLRTKCEKFEDKTNSRNCFYEIVYNSLYSSAEESKKKYDNKKRKRRKPSQIKARKNSKSTTNSRNTRNSRIRTNNKVQQQRRKRGRPKLIEREWPKLPIQVKTEEFESESLRCPIEGCLHVATNQKMFTIHQSTHADPSLLNAKEVVDVPATCDECGKVLKNRLQLRVHVRRIHEQSERCYCPFEGCDANYARQPCLRKHIRIVHTKDAREYRCTWVGCSYMSYTSGMLRKHVNVHTGERPYKCVWPGCEKAFKSHSSLDFHKSIHANRRQYKCQWPGCGYACNVPSNLTKHVAIHERKRMKMIEGGAPI